MRKEILYADVELVAEVLRRRGYADVTIAYVDRRVEASNGSRHFKRTDDGIRFHVEVIPRNYGRLSLKVHRDIARTHGHRAITNGESVEMEYHEILSELRCST